MYENLVIVKGGKRYSSIKNPLIFPNLVKEYFVNENRQRIISKSTFVDDGNELKLQFIGVYSCINSKDELSFEEVIEKEIVFDKTTCKATGDKITYEDIKVDGFNSSLVILLDKIVESNVNVDTFLKTLPKFLVNRLNICDYTFIINLYNMLIFNLLEFEKLINSNNTKFLEQNLHLKDFSLSEANKLHQILGLPKFAVQLVKEYDLEDFAYDLKPLNDVLDGNSFKIFLEFLGNTRLLWGSTKTKTDAHKMKKFLADASYVLDKSRNYKVTDFLCYILRQNMYFRDEADFGFPFNETMFLKDYIEMCETYGLKYEKYPQKIKRMHNLTAKNVKSLENASPEVEAKFLEAINEYIDVERTMKYVPDPKHPEIYTEYAFIVPRSIKDLIQEGNDMHHCVGSYGNKTIDRQARIVFMRLADKKNESYITVDIDVNYNLVEAKKAYNEEIDDEQRKALNKWLSACKKAKFA